MAGDALVCAAGPREKERPVAGNELLLFAVIAASKLYLYISSFGFTPLRLQSAWLIVVLFAGCACALYALWGGKKAMKGWMLFAGVTLALLHLY